MNNDVSFDVMITDADKQPIVGAVNVRWFAPYPLMSNLFGSASADRSMQTGKCFEKYKRDSSHARAFSSTDVDVWFAGGG